MWFAREALEVVVFTGWWRGGEGKGEGDGRGREGRWEVRGVGDGSG